MRFHAPDSGSILGKLVKKSQKFYRFFTAFHGVPHFLV